MPNHFHTSLADRSLAFVEVDLFIPDATLQLVESLIFGGDSAHQFGNGIQKKKSRLCFCKPTPLIRPNSRHRRFAR